MKNSISKKISNEIGKAKINANSENGIKTLKTEYVLLAISEQYLVIY